MRNAIPILAIAIFLVGCASSGTRLQQSEIEKIEPGVTTYADMEEMFGSPVGQAYNQGGLLTASWMYVFAGPFGVGTEYQTLAVVFNEDKTVRQYNVSKMGRPIWSAEE